MNNQMHAGHGSVVILVNSSGEHRGLNGSGLTEMNRWTGELSVDVQIRPGGNQGGNVWHRVPGGERLRSPMQQKQK
jgi:hypothetical protein